MIIVKTEIKESPTHGIGLFALEDIKEGQIVITETTPGLDIELAEDEFQKLPQGEQDFIDHYGFHNKFTGKHHLTHDNTRFINHNPDGNISYDSKKEILFANKDIKAGEEITQNYSEFENVRDKLEGFK